MAKTTFSGPVVSNNGFAVSGSGSVVQLAAADTTLTFNDHAGRIVEVNDADGVITLPSITSDTIGAKYTIYIGTASTSGKLKTDGTDKFVGSLTIVGATTMAFVPGASNDVIDMNDGTKGGKVGSVVEFTALATAEYLVQGVSIGSGTVATPFADS
jgi:hypothetical protein